jgi:hypothetical protein
MNNYYRSDGWVKTTQGPAVPGAQVYILSQPANVTPTITPPRSTPVPFTPNPQVQVYSDAGFTPIIQPIITDGFGHYDFYALPGLYTVAVYYGGKLQQFYTDQSIGSVGSSGGTSISLLTNGSLNFNQNILNLVQGAGIIVVTDNLGNAVITNLNPTPYVPPSPTPRVSAIFYTIDGGGTAIGTGAKGQLSVPMNCTITGWVLTSDQSGSAVVDVLTSTYGAFPTTNSIASSDKPTLATAQKNENLSISVWSTALTAGQQLQFNVNSASTVTRLNLTLLVTIP